MSRDRCHECGRSLSLIPGDEIERHRESLGFGAANDRLRSFCSVRCKARYVDADVVLLSTRQTTLAMYGTACDEGERYVYGV